VIALYARCLPDTNEDPHAAQPSGTQPLTEDSGGGRVDREGPTKDWDEAGRWEAFGTTVFEVPASAEELLRPATSFGVVTAFNPGRVLDAGENTTRDRALHDALVASRLPHMRVVGRSPTGHHREPSFAVFATPEEIVRLGRAYEQDAVFTIHADELFLYPCAPGAGPMPLGSWSSRVLHSREILLDCPFCIGRNREIEPRP
jgi:hypothetical protein